MQFMKHTPTLRVARIPIGIKLCNGNGALWLNNTEKSCCNIVFTCFCSLLPPGVMQIYLEIYDECSFSMDELVAWGHVDIPPQVLEKGDTHEDWYRLSGKQGDNQEGMINLVFSYSV